MTEEELRKEREQKISKDLATSENLIRHAFNQGNMIGYQRGLEDGKRQGVAIDGDKRYWKGYNAAQEDGKKIYRKGYEDGARCQDEVQYQKGLDDAWDAAKKLTHPRYDGYRDDEKKEIFGFIESDLILIKMSASEAIEKIRAYEEKQKQEEARSGYVVCDEPIKPEKTVFPDSPCDLCVYNPPSSFDGKPCTMCPAERRSE